MSLLDRFFAWRARRMSDAQLLRRVHHRGTRERYYAAVRRYGR